MLDTEQMNRLREILKPDIVIELDKTVATPFDLFQLQAQLNAIKSKLLAYRGLLDTQSETPKRKQFEPAL